MKHIYDGLYQKFIASSRVNTLSKMAHLYLVILAGGEGTRLFPYSNPGRPKQLCPIGGNNPRTNTFIKRTIANYINCGFNRERIIVITSNGYQTRLIKRQITGPGGIPLDNIWEIPSSFGYSGTMVETTKRITEFDSEAIILNTPSDHILTPDYKFIEAVFTAVINAEKGYVSAIGVKTNSLDTVMACGNIIYDQEKLNNGITISKDFIEKPGITRARELIKNDTSVCNTGICVWRADALLEYAPKNTKDLTTERLMRAFNGRLRIVVGEFQWQDCGTLRGLYSALDKMPHTQNVVLGEGRINLDNSCKRSLFYADKGLSLNVSDTSDCAIIFTKVHNQPVLLISHLDESQKIKELAEDYSRHEKILIDDFSLGARNNRVLYSNMYYEYSVGFVNVEDYIVHIVRRSNYGDIEAEIFKKKSTSTK